LLIATDNWYGSPRLPAVLKDAGFAVGLLSTPGTIASASSAVERLFPLSSGRPTQIPMAWEAIDAFAPDFMVPGDEQAVRLMRALAHSPLASSRPAALAVLRRSLPARLGQVLGRTQMLDVAASAGIECPAHTSVRSVRQALAFFEKHGGPVFLKRDGTAGGNGVRQCDDAASLRVAFAQLTNTDHSPWSPEGALRRCRQFFRGIGMGQDPGMSVEAAVPGQPAFHTAVALNGKWLGGISAEVDEFQRPTGSSTRVRLHVEEAMDEAARRLTAVVGYNGFCGLDFIRRPDGGLTFLEFNWRPTPVTHLGRLVGRDLAVALFSALTGEPSPALPAASSVKVALFPQDWLRDPFSHDRGAYHADIPVDDPSLLAAFRKILPAGWDKTGS
jgi:hypothetical protein